MLTAYMFFGTSAFVVGAVAGCCATLALQMRRWG